MVDSHPSPAYYPSRWPAEDGGPRRNQVPHTGAGLGLRQGERLAAHFRFDPAATMVVQRDEGELYLQRHTLGPDSVGIVERIDPITLEVIRHGLVSIANQIDADLLAFMQVTAPNFVGTPGTLPSTTTTYNYYSTLPCSPNTVVVEGVTYYQCGADWYTQAYAGESVNYLLVAPPPGY